MITITLIAIAGCAFGFIHQKWTDYVNGN